MRYLGSARRGLYDLLCPSVTNFKTNVEAVPNNRSNEHQKTDTTMTVLKDLKPIFLYGLIMAILIFALKWMQWKFLLVDHAIEIYIGLIALFFTLLGIWIATQLVKPTVKTIRFEKEASEMQIPDETELNKLKLSNREYEVLQLLAQGYTNKAIGEALFISLSTVKTHVSNLYVKMEVKNRVQATEKAKRLKIIR